MLIGHLRTGFLVAILLASFHVPAAPRYWVLTGAQLEDGAVSTGYLSFDDATGTVDSWTMRLDGGSGPFIAWTFVPGNSWTSAAYAAPRVYPYLYSYTNSPPLVPGFRWRSLIIDPSSPLDGSSSTVPIDLSTSRDFFEDDFGNVGKSRSFVAGSLVLTAVPPPVTTVQVDEFHHRGRGRYFMTADPAEKQILDTGVHPGWERTGESFTAYATGSSASGSINPVCRYYGDPARGLGSHFYSADSMVECIRVFEAFSSQWLLESDNVFQINLPDKTTGACPTETIPVYRVWNEQDGSNHRYTTSTTLRANMLAEGYVAEGYGPDGVVMCAVQ